LRAKLSKILHIHKNFVQEKHTICTNRKKPLLAQIVIVGGSSKSYFITLSPLSSY